MRASHSVAQCGVVGAVFALVVPQCCVVVQSLLELETAEPANHTNYDTLSATAPMRGPEGAVEPFKEQDEAVHSCCAMTANGWRDMYVLPVLVRAVVPVL